jgi:Leucine-rich repeat (LRR) protein
MRELPKMPQLRALYARHTKLDRIPDYGDLHRVNVSHTSVEMIPNLMKLTHLDVSYTLVSMIPDCLIYLEHLNVSSSQVTKLSSAYRHLRVLKAMNTELQWIPAYPKLEVLYIKGSVIVELPRMPQLRYLDVEATTVPEPNGKISASRSKVPMVAVVG